MAFTMTLRLECDLCAHELNLTGTDDSLYAPKPWVMLTPGHVFSFTFNRPDHPLAFCSMAHAQTWAEEHRHPNITTVKIEGS